jgi:minor extracellular serine protease Vpr
MNRRLLVAVAGAATLAASLVAGPVMAAGPTRPEGVKLADIDPSFRPYLADEGRKVTVVLQLEGAPVVASGASSSGQARTLAAGLRSKQRALDGRIKAAGGRITGRYQYAYNGIRVSTSGKGVTRLAALPGVVAIRPLRVYTLQNANAIPYVNAPTAWEANGATGAGVTIAVIDGGIDYTHADFGGPGTTEAYEANDSTVIEPGTFPTAKVIAGYDFAGNDYDASGDVGSTTPTPDADPLDCDGHGSHVAGSAAGQGVTAAHGTYGGPYTGDLDLGAFTVAPGVAPEASLVALKVFGCDGSTDLVVDALEWVASYNASHDDGIDVVNMSLGAPFGHFTDPDAVATDNLVRSGVVVVASAGNESSVPYITGAPAAATKAISVAALDALPTVPAVSVELSGGAVDGINMNGYPDLPVSGTLHVVAGSSAGLSLGCTVGEYDAATAGTIAVIRRGDCVLVDKGAAAQAAGAIGVIVVNRTDTADAELPPYVEPSPLFEIPMAGTSKTAYDALVAGDGQPATLADNGTQPNSTYQQLASFSSSGPRWGDSWLKPDVAAPGVSMVSAANGSGWNGMTLSGTSMAAPVTAGVAALVRESHPRWSPLKVKAAIANTADGSDVSIAAYDPLRAGAGVIQADRAVAAKVVATTSDGTASLNFGYEPTDGSYSETKSITIHNTSNATVRFTLAASSPLVKITPSSVKVRGRDTVEVRVQASLSKSQVAALPSADQYQTGAFGELSSMSGVVTLTPTQSATGVGPLRVPYLLVPRGLSDVQADLGGGKGGHGAHAVTTAHGGGGGSGSATPFEGTIRVRNGGVHAGTADVYALGVTDPRGDGLNGMDVRAAGVQVLPGEAFGAPETDRGIQFVINMYDRFSTPAPHEVDVAVDTSGDGEADYYVVGYDEGAAFADLYDGLFLSLIVDATTFDIVDAWLADAPLNGSSVILPALASDLGLAEGSGEFTWWVAAFDGFTGLADETGVAKAFDAYDPAQSTGDSVTLAPRASAEIEAWAKAGVKDPAWLVVTLDDANGGAQADIVKNRR